MNELQISPDSRETKAIIRKWYERLEFPKEYDREFEKALETIPVSDTITIDTYGLHCEDGKRNLLSFLYMCEDSSSGGIPTKRTFPTRSAIRIFSGESRRPF